MTDALNIAELSGGYGQLRVIRDVTVDVPTSSVTAVLGLNGAGKSTLLRIVTGLATQHSGTVTIDGDDVTSFDTAGRLARIGYVPEGRLLLGSFSVRDNIYLFAARRRGKREARNAVERAFELFPVLRARAYEDAQTLSGGQQQMLAIGRALALEPRLLLLDEPSIGLAPVILDELAEVVRRLTADGLSVLVCEQNTHWISGLVERAYVLQHGRVIARGDGSLVEDSAALREHYFGTPELTMHGDEEQETMK